MDKGVLYGLKSSMDACLAIMQNVEADGAHIMRLFEAQKTAHSSGLLGPREYLEWAWQKVNVLHKLMDRAIWQSKAIHLLVSSGLESAKGEGEYRAILQEGVKVLLQCRELEGKSMEYHTALLEELKESEKSGT